MVGFEVPLALDGVKLGGSEEVSGVPLPRLCGADGTKLGGAKDPSSDME
jgi:hypothetical protein